MTAVLYQNPKEAHELFLKFINKTEESIEKDVDTIEEWIKTQPHLPEVTSRKHISTFLKINKCSIELTKKQIDMYYSMRSLIPEVFENSHPKLPHMQEVPKKLYNLRLPKLTKEGNAVTILKIRANDPSEISNYYHCLAHALNIVEVRLAEEISIRDVVIFDCEGFGMTHLLRITPTFLKHVSLIFTSMFLSRVHELHIVNCPVGESLVRLLKSCLSPKLSERIIVHSQFKSLLDYIPKEALPKDYGGNELSLEELNDLWQEKLREYYPRFDQLATMRVKEELRPTPLKNDEVLGFHGNFKKLDVD